LITSFRATGFTPELRASELIGLMVKDINLDDGIIKVKGKGAKKRIMPSTG